MVSKTDWVSLGLKVSVGSGIWALGSALRAVVARLKPNNGARASNRAESAVKLGDDCW